MTGMPVLAILCPVHNESTVAPLFYARLEPVIARLSDRYLVRLVFLNNASTDQTAAAIVKIRVARSETYLITMSRNVGYQRSLELGLRTVDADVYVFIDVDCEDPPEMIDDFVARYEDGYEIVYGERVDREEPRMIKHCRDLFYHLLQATADEEIILNMAEFALFTREVRDAIISECSSFPFIRASIARVGFRRAAIPFKRQRRIAGKTHYNLFRMTVFAVAGILATSTLPLRLPVYILPIWFAALTLLSIGYGATHSDWYAIAAFLAAAAYLGVSAAVTALYVARTYKNGLVRPNAFIDRRASFLPPARADEGADASPTPSPRVVEWPGDSAPARSVLRARARS
jgi:dolichol-phosphate mannosyltransferase